MTLWAAREPGDTDAVMKVIDDEPGMLLLQAPGTLPDWVRLPRELGAAELRTVRQFTRGCPKCGVPVRHIECEQGVFVAECVVHNFMFYQLEAKA